MSSPPSRPAANPPVWLHCGWARRLAHFDEETGRLNPTLLAHVLLSGGLLLASIVLYIAAAGFIVALSANWRICPIFAAEITDPETAAVPAPSMPPSSAAGSFPSLVAVFADIDGLGRMNDAARVDLRQKRRLKEQLAQLEKGQRNSCSIGVFFFANRNAALTVSTAAGILAIVSLAIVSKQGWEKTNNTIINIGITSGLILFSVWTFSQLYGQGINYESYRSKYTLATNLLNRIASAAANGSVLADPDGGSGPAVPLDLNTAAGMASLLRLLDVKLEVIERPEFSGDTSFAQSSAERLGGLLNLRSTGAAPTPQVQPLP